ncbi:MAG TPA: isochorismatase family protein [Candidatus Limnocylindria bacterium]|nr:isochorismatase family protein [Candidatus Limnocylindria bacterium]
MAAYDPRTALLVVDVQNDFADPDGGLSVPGGATIVPKLNREIRAAIEAGASVIYTQDWHPSSTPHFAKDGGIWPVHCVGETWGAAFHPELLVAGPSVRKGVDGGDGYSGFSVRDPASGDEHATELESLLLERGVERVVIGGLATDYCVRETTLDAIERGFTATVLTDAVAAVDLQPGDGAAALDAMAAAGALLAASDDGG